MVYEDSICIQTRYLKEFNWLIINFWISSLQLRSLKFRQHIRENRLKPEFIQGIVKVLDETNPTEKYVRVGLNEEGKLDWKLEN